MASIHTTGVSSILMYVLSFSEHAFFKSIFLDFGLKPLLQWSPGILRYLKNKQNNTLSGLQIKVHIGKLFSLFLIQTICCGYSKEPSQ